MTDSQIHHLDYSVSNRSQDQKHAELKTKELVAKVEIHFILLNFILFFVKGI